MRHNLPHRTLRALAALSIAFTATPVTAVAAPAEEGHRPASVVADGTAVGVTVGPEETVPATVTRAELDGRGHPCGPGPCPMPFTTCPASGACMSIAPLPADAISAPFAGLSRVSVHGTATGPPSAAPGILTPPPRG